MILQALIEGGWNNDKEEGSEESKNAAEDRDSSENALVNSILKERDNEQQMVQSALNSQTVSMKSLSGPTCRVRFAREIRSELILPARTRDS